MCWFYYDIISLNGYLGNTKHLRVKTEQLWRKVQNQQIFSRNVVMMIFDAIKLNQR